MNETKREAFIQTIQNPELQDLGWLVYFFEDDKLIAKMQFKSSRLAKELQTQWLDNSIWF